MPGLIRLWIKAPSLDYAVECCNERGLPVARRVSELTLTKYMIVDVKASEECRREVGTWYAEPPPPRPQEYPFGALLVFRDLEEE